MIEPRNLRVEIYQDLQVVFSDVINGTIEIGRQKLGEAKPFSINRDVVPHRLVIAPLDARSVSRNHARIEQTESGIQVSNISKVSKILIRNLPAANGVETLEAGATQRVSLPVALELGAREVRILEPQTQLHGFDRATEPPSIHNRSIDETLMAPALQTFRSPDQMDGPELMSWLRNVLDLFQASPGEHEFFEQSTAVVAQMLKLDSAAILFRQGSHWEVKHLFQRGGVKTDADWRPSMTILDAVTENVRVFRQLPTGDQAQSLLEVTSLVAAPILATDGSVIGALYGDKRFGQSSGSGDISEVEAMFVELLASGIAAGLARQEKEKQVVQARVRFEQFFPAGLVDKLEADQDFLKGKDSEVTVMFCDIRKFSQIAERVGPETTVEFIGDALQQLSECVLAHNGVLVDYIADELIAMWGAPETQPNHAMLAVQAGQEMMKRVPELNDRWKERIGTDFQIGIGLNSGIAQVGNIGSKLRFKYGPLGNPVNIASRVQGVTKQLKTPFLITYETASRLDAGAAYRKLCQVQLVNVAKPVMVCEVPQQADESWHDLKSSYEAGLESFEQKQFLEACDKLSATLKCFPNDTPTMNLLSRSVKLLSEGNQSEDSVVWKLDSK